MKVDDLGRMDDDEGERLRHRVLFGKGVLLKQPDIGVHIHL